MGLFNDGSVRKISLVPSDQRYCYNYKIGEDLGWRNVISLSSSRSHLAGLTKDGRVLVESSSCYSFEGAKKWQNVVCVRTGYESMAGIFSDGTMRYTYNGNDDSYQSDIKNVKDVALCGRSIYVIDEEGTLFQSGFRENTILAKECGKVNKLGLIENTIYGLTAEGYVKELHSNDGDIQIWSCVTRIASGDRHLLGLTEDGRVLWMGDKSEQAEAFNSDSKIIDIYAGCYHSLAMNEEGYLFSPRNYWNSYC